MYKFKEQDTTWLQMESVIKCAKSLKYEFNGRAFYTRIKLPYKDIKTYYLSFSDMQMIHNQGFYFQSLRGISVKGHLTMVNYVGLHNKIVETSYLQYNKKIKDFQTTKNMIRFV